MKQTQYRHRLLSMVLIGMFLLTFFTCTKQEEEGRISPKQQAGQVAEPNYAEILNEIELVQQQILKSPADSELHAQLVELGVDTSLGLLRAAGRGEPPMEARSPAIAQQAAQDAAYIDACQWIAYMLEWRKHPDTPEFGKIHAELPGARLVHKIVDGNVTRVLVESELP